MSVNKKGLEVFYKKLSTLRKDTGDIISELLIGEGVYAVKQAKVLCKNDTPDIVNTGNYRNNWHAGDSAKATAPKVEYDGSKPAVLGIKYSIDVYNNADYASHLEYGFRSHWVPGKWAGHTFVYIRGYRKGGMHVGKPGKYVKGHFVLRRAITNTKATQAPRLQRKLNKILKERIG